MSAEYSELKQNFAQKAFDTLCLALDNMKWKYNRDAANRVVTTTAIGKDLTINLRMVVSEERRLMYIKSLLPFDVPESKRDVVGRAVNIANFSILNGCFEYDQFAGKLGFRIVVPFFNTELTEEVYHYAVMLTCQMVDKFNDKILALANGTMTLQEFKEFAQK